MTKFIIFSEKNKKKRDLMVNFARKIPKFSNLRLMLFNSFEFLAFLPIVFLLYWGVFRTRRWQNLWVVVASYVFYGWWD